MGIFDFMKNIRESNKICCTQTNEFKAEEFEFIYPIKYNTTNPSKLFTVNDLEKEFFKHLYKKLDISDNNKIKLTRMSDGTLNVMYSSYQVGRIKLQGRKHSMQVLYSTYDNESIDGFIDDFIENIDYWVMYIIRYLKISRI